MGFPGGTSGKVLACHCRKLKTLEFNPWVGKIPWRRAWQPTPLLLPGRSHGQRSLAGYSPWGCKESDTTEQLHFLSFYYNKCNILSHNVSVSHPVSWRYDEQKLRFLVKKKRWGVGGEILPSNCNIEILLFQALDSSSWQQLLSRSPGCWLTLCISDLPAPTLTWVNSLK